MGIQVIENSIRTFEDLVDYWNPRIRVVSRSNKLNQSKEFINERRMFCLEQLAYWKDKLNDDSKIIKESV